MFEDLNLNTSPFIIFIVYFLIWGIKTLFLKSNESRKHIPPIAAALGCAIAIALHYGDPTVLNASNITDACVTGITSGLAAVGFNQVFKQYKKFKSTDDTTYDYCDEETKYTQAPVTTPITASLNNIYTEEAASTEPTTTVSSDDTTATETAIASSDEITANTTSEDINEAYDDDRVGG